jgi:hypothetical protein
LKQNVKTIIVQIRDVSPGGVNELTKPCLDAKVELDVEQVLRKEENIAKLDLKRTWKSQKTLCDEAGGSPRTDQMERVTNKQSENVPMNVVLKEEQTGQKE